MDTDVTIRECREADLSEVLRLMVHWAAERITHGYVPSTEARLRATLGPLFLVAETAERLAGFLRAHELVGDGNAVIAAGEPCLEIDDLYVVPEHRDEGIGSRLIDHVREVARRRGIRHVVAYSAAKDLDPVLRFYRRHGFRTWYVQLYLDL